MATIALLMGRDSWEQQTQPAKINLPATRKFTKILSMICLMLLLWGQSNAQLVWSGAASCAGGAATTWLTAANWCNGSASASAAPQSTQFAQFGSLGTGASIGMNMNGVSAANKTVGAIEITTANTVARTITNSSTTVFSAIVLAGVTVNSISNVIVRNNSTTLLTFGGTNSFGVSLGNTTENIVNIDNTGGVTISWPIKDSTGGAKNLTKAGSGAGVLTLSNPSNSYSGTTSINTGELRLNPSSTPATFASQILLNGGTLGTTSITASTVITSSSTLNLSNNSTIALGSTVHSLKFAASNAVSWTAAKTITITGWTGTAGSSGTAGKIFVGTSATGLTSTQLAQITFSGFTNGTTILSTGEVVPSLAATPTITGTATATAFTTIYGTASTPAQTFPVTGSNLTADITATAPTGFEVSSNGTNYGSTATFTQASGSASGTLSVRLAANAAVTGSYNSLTISLTSTGATTVNITTASSGNAVSTKALTITGLTGANKSYNGNANATFTGTAAYSGLANSESYTVTGTPTASFANATVANGKIISVSGYTAPSTNYTLTQPSLTGNITAVALSITAADQTVTYGTAASTVTGAGSYTVTGYVSPETSTVISGSVSYTTTYTNTTTAASSGVTITPVVSGLTATNYSFIPLNGTISINKASSSITATGSGSFIYDGLTHGPSTSNVTGSGGAVTYTYSGTGSTTYSNNTTAPTDAGTYQVIASVVADANYNSATSSAFPFSIISAAVPLVTSTLTASATAGTNEVKGGFGFGVAIPQLLFQQQEYLAD